jgi:renalase
MTAADVLVIGAGVAGLACARRLHDAGRSVLILERSRGVGGRCATRRILDGLAVDHGVAFLHGSDEDFLDALAEVPGERRDGWPHVVDGNGPPCQRGVDRDRCTTFVDGVSAFPKHLARGLSVVTEATVKAVTPGRVTLTDDRAFAAPHVVFAAAVDQTAALVPDLPLLAPARAVLSDLRTVPCLTVIAAYPLDTPDPGFDMGRYGGDLHVVVHDSSKRKSPSHRVLVLQASAQASHAWMADDPAIWSARLLALAADRLGPWAATPAWSTPHRWKYARFPGPGTNGPLLFDGFSFIGEAFSPVGGIQGAYLSGSRLAGRLLARAQ